jgi:hypothetical protein
VFEERGHFDYFDNLVATQNARQLLWSIHSRQITHFVALPQGDFIEKHEGSPDAPTIGGRHSAALREFHQVLADLFPRRMFRRDMIPTEPSQVIPQMRPYDLRVPPKGHSAQQELVV